MGSKDWEDIPRAEQTVNSKHQESHAKCRIQSDNKTGDSEMDRRRRGNPNQTHHYKCL